MEKLKKTFKINPLYEADGYKVGHPLMMVEGVTKEYFTWIPRDLKHMEDGIDMIMSGGQQIVVRFLHSLFQENFFDQPIEVAHRFTRDISKYLLQPYNFEGYSNLHKLGYLPIRIKSLPEGIFTKKNIPHMTGINTVDGYAWLGLFLETLMSKLAWQCPTAATIAYHFRKNSHDWVKNTDLDNLWLAQYMNHDFHSRGGNPYSSVAVGLGHAFSNLGSDTLNVIPASRYYYDFDEEEVPIFSVNASEHSITCIGIFYYMNKLESGQLNEEIDKYYSTDIICDGSLENPDYLAIAELLNLKDWLNKFPKGILSYVCDTFSTWKLITHILPRLKEEIMSRGGKLVIRGDTGDPVDIICGEQPYIDDLYKDGKYYNNATGEEIIYDFNSPKMKGIVELLWDIFGGIVNSQGYKVLDSHIGSIYGDSINLQRQVDIYKRLASKGFAATNVILGPGSYTYIMRTRDSAGFAMKGSWFEMKGGLGFDIFKDPATGDGTKKSLRGRVCVEEIINKSGEKEIVVIQQCSEEEEKEGLLQIIYEDGKFKNQTILTEIRERINKTL